MRHETLSNLELCSRCRGGGVIHGEEACPECCTTGRIVRMTITIIEPFKTHEQLLPRNFDLEFKP